MSIKSQKSLLALDECSEIFERSYSVKSLSDETLSGEEDEEYLCRELFRKLSPAVLSKLKKKFKKWRGRATRNIDTKVDAVMRAAAADEGIEFPPSANQSTPHLYLDEEGFVNTLDDIFGNQKYSGHSRALYHALDRFKTGCVSWSQLVARLVASGSRSAATRLDTWLPVEDAGVVKLEHCKREKIVTMLRIDRPDMFCYIAISRGGRVGVYDRSFTLLKSYEVFSRKSGVHRRVKNCWITDAVYMEDVCCVCVSASERSITIYDVSTHTHTPLYCVTSLPHIPTCLAYSGAGSKSLLAVGSERGDVTSLSFLQPRVSLLPHNSDNIHYYYWFELVQAPHTSYCALHTWKRIHARSVRRLAFTRRGEILLSCSHDGDVSLRMKYVSGMLSDYEISVPRGVSCLAVSAPLRVVVGGGRDGRLRVWTLAQREHFATLGARGPPSPVVDVCVLEDMKLIVACCADCSVSFWDLYEECLLQSIKLRFPFLGVLGKKIEFGTSCLFLGAPQHLSQCTGEQIPTGEPSVDCSLRDEDGSHQTKNVCEVLVSCGDSFCVLRVCDVTQAELTTYQEPPEWDLNTVNTLATFNHVTTATATDTAPATPTSAALPAEIESEQSQQDPLITEDIQQVIDSLALNNIFDKNFVTMWNAKHDINKKLHQMELNCDSHKSTAGVSAPYLTLQSYELDPLPDFQHLHQRYSSVSKFFPGPSINITPVGSQTTTPRHKL